MKLRHQHHGRNIFTTLALAAAAISASAATLQVIVTGPDGRPAADVAVMVQPASTVPMAAPAGPTVIEQKDIRFAPFVTVVPLGGTVRFVNKDRYDHHVRSLAGGPLGNVAPAKTFEFRMAGVKGGVESSAEVRFDQPGIVALGCHLHGSMRGHLVVSVTPHVAVTDSAGRATIHNVPDGQAEIRLWHPEQLSDQTAARAQVATNATRTELKLNFSPRTRSTVTPPTNRYE